MNKCKFCDSEESVTTFTGCAYVEKADCCKDCSEKQLQKHMEILYVIVKQALDDFVKKQQFISNIDVNRTKN